MWALTKKPIKSAEALKAMQEWKDGRGLHSDHWILPRTLELLQTCRQSEVSLTLPARLLFDGNLRAVPFLSLSSKFRASALAAAPHPAGLDGPPMILEPSSPAANSTPPFRPGDIIWRECTLDELFDAAIPACDDHYACEGVLCSTALVPVVPGVDTLTVINAQEARNPFAVDPLLAHLDLATGEPLPAAVFSGLTTAARQFRYTSLKWAKVRALDAGGGEDLLTAAALSAGAQVHCVTTRAPVLLAHLSQLPLDAQHTVISHVPRHALFKATVKPFVLCNGRWIHASGMHLDRKLYRRDVPPTLTEDPATQPLLWVSVAEGDLGGLTGPPLHLTRTFRDEFLNQEQLPSLSTPAE